MSHSSAYRPENDAVLSTLSAVRMGTIAWVLAAAIGVPILLARDAGAGWWLLTCAIGVISGVGGLLFLRGKLKA